MPNLFDTFRQQFAERAADRLFGDLIETRVQNAVKVVDDKWWTQVVGSAAPNDLRWSDRQAILGDALTAWRVNPLARQLVRLTRGFVLQDGIQFHAKRKKDQKFVDEFWNHKRSKMNRRLQTWCDALTLFGEVFPVLFFNHADGMSYVRSVPAKSIDAIETKPGDYETHLKYHQITDVVLPGSSAKTSLVAPMGGRDWYAAEYVGDNWATMPENRPEMLHFAVNVPDGGTRGSGDLDPVLEWLARYKSWLTDRWSINKSKAEWVWDLSIEGADQGVLNARKRDFEKSTGEAGGIYVHNEKESLNVKYPGIAADTVAPDGQAMRLMVAAGGGVALHHLGENEVGARASASNADRGTLSHYATRQNDLIGFCCELIDRAAWRASTVGRVHYPHDGFAVTAEVAELTREDNLMLAQATQAMVSALASAKVQGWVDDETAMGLMLKFAGEIIDVQEVMDKVKSDAQPKITISKPSGNPNGSTGAPASQLSIGATV